MTNHNYTTLNDFFNDTAKSVTTGDYVRTYGYNEAGDGGSGTYRVNIIESTDGSLAIVGNKFTKGNIELELIFDNGAATVEQFGAVRTEDTDGLDAEDIALIAANNRSAIQLAIDSGARRVYFTAGTYYVAEDIAVDHPVDIAGNGAELVLTTSSTSTQLFRVQYGEDVTATAAGIRDMKIVGTRVETYETNSETGEVETVVTYYNYGIKLVNVSDFTVSGVEFEYGNYAVYAKPSSTENNINNINVANCNVVSADNGFFFATTKGAKVVNCKIDLESDSNYSALSKIGVYLLSNTRRVLIEDVSVYNTATGVSIATNYATNDETENVDARDRIFVKNLFVENAYDLARVNFNTLPVHFANVMAVDVRTSMRFDRCENVSVSNSSFALLPPDRCPAASSAIVIYGATKAKFTHTQFDFPWAFETTPSPSFTDSSELVFVDCTLQKTDIADTPGVTSPSGFGILGHIYVSSKAFTQIFDACEFRSYIQDYAITTNNDGVETTTYNFPATVAAPSNTGSKLIIKNCRFVNDSPCSIPYFKLKFHSEKYEAQYQYDNIVVYNCFFENYVYSPDDGATYPIFGKVESSGITTATKESDSDGNTLYDYNIFAKSNMRSSTPVRNTGTTINETVIYE